MTRTSGRRIAIFDSMSGWPLEKWIPIDEVHRFITASGNDLDTCRQPMYLYFGCFEYGYLTDGEALDVQYLRAFLMESLGTLGLVDVAYVFPHYRWPDFRGERGTDGDSFTGRYDGLLYVRLNRLGAYCLGLADTYETGPSVEKRLFKVLPNHEVVILDHSETRATIMHMLESIARRKSDNVWKIERGSILGHLESGGSTNDIAEFLEAYADDGIPDQVRTFLADISRKARACKSTDDAVLVELANEQSAAEIAHDVKASKVCRLVGTTSVVVLKKNMNAFRKALKAMGYVLPQ